MRRPKHNVNQVRELADHLGQCVQSVFNALIRRKQAEREHHVFAFDPELVAGDPGEGTV